MSSQTWCCDQLLIPLFFLIEDHPRVIDYPRPQCWATEQEDGVFPWQRVLWIKTKKQKLRDDFKDSSRSTNMQPSWTLKWILRMFPPTSSCFLLQAPPPLTGVAYHSAVRHTDCGCRRSTLTVYYLDRCVVAFMLWWLGCYSDSQHVCLCAAFWLVETVQSCVCECGCVYLLRMDWCEITFLLTYSEFKDSLTDRLLTRIFNNQKQRW